MSQTPNHICEAELVLAVNSELSSSRRATVDRHIASCDSCAARLASFDAALGSFAEAHRSETTKRLPQLDPARAEFERRLAASAERGAWRSWLPTPRVAGLALAGAAALSVVAGAGLFRSEPTESSRFAPDPALTPGVAREVRLAELCEKDAEAEVIPRAAALAVFRQHGIEEPQAGEYELDYLIPPELGGANDSRNLWPQPYQVSPWNAYAKDALEDRLRQMACAGQLDLKAAQQAIAQDWTAAYQKYFDTPEPLLSHATFLKDDPWE